MSEDEWQPLQGDLRAALAARAWREAGALVHKMCRIDEDRYARELADWVATQYRMGGYHHQSDTEKRLDLIREHVRTLLDNSSQDPSRQWAVLIGLRDMATGGRIHRSQRLPSIFNDLVPGLMSSEVVVRADVQDAVWGVLQEYPELLELLRRP